MTEAGGQERFDEQSLAFIIEAADHCAALGSASPDAFLSTGPPSPSAWLQPSFPWSAVVFTEDWPLFRDTVRQAVARGGDFSVACRLKAHAHGPVLATVSGRTVHAADGEPSWIEGVISPQERPLCNGCREAVIRGEKQAKEFCRNILSVLSHDIRSPLIGVIGMLQLLRKSGLDGKQAEYASMASESCERILELAQNLLDFARIDSGKDSLNLQPVDIPGVLDSVAKLHAEHSMRGGVALEQICAGSFPDLVFSDEIKLRQILGNLISNAIKFTPSGSVTVELSHVERQTGGVNVLISVADTGVGFDLSETRYMFDQFAQLCQDHRIRCMGAGLGLTIVKSLVDLFGGSICADSEPGKGATFLVSLPADVPTD